MIDIEKNSVILYPSSFGYGPVVHALLILKVLKEKNPNIRYFLISDNYINQIILQSKIIDRDSIMTSEDLNRFNKRGKSKTLVITITNNEVLPKLSTFNVEVLVVDALLWMWNKIPDIPNNVIAYMALSFPNVKSRICQISKKTKAKVIDQITVTPKANENTRAGLIINLGGSFSPFGCSYPYLACLIKDINEISQSQDVTVTCSETCKKYLVKLGVKVKMITLNPFEMIDLLVKSDTLITLPGLSIVWDAVLSKIRTIVVPGINYSQHLQPKSYKRFLENLPIFSWDDIEGYESLDAGLEEHIAVEKSISIANRFAKDSNGRSQLKQWMIGKLKLRNNIPYLGSNHPYGGFNGTEHVAELVNEWLFNKIND